MSDETEYLTRLLIEKEEVIRVLQDSSIPNLAQAWSKGHAAGRDYQGDGWNSDSHDPEDDNPYRDEQPRIVVTITDIGGDL